MSEGKYHDADYNQTFFRLIFFEVKLWDIASMYQNEIHIKITLMDRIWAKKIQSKGPTKVRKPIVSDIFRTFKYPGI